MTRRARAAFTLVELMVVVVIIGVLAGFAIPRFWGTRREAYIAALRSDLRNLVSAEELFSSDSGRYTASVANLNVKPTAGTALVIVTGAGYWSATATHAQLPPTYRCGIAVNAPNPIESSVPDAQSVCTDSKGGTRGAY